MQLKNAGKIQAVTLMSSNYELIACSVTQGTISRPQGRGSWGRTWGRKIGD